MLSPIMLLYLSASAVADSGGGAHRLPWRSANTLLLPTVNWHLQGLLKRRAKFRGTKSARIEARQIYSGSVKIMFCLGCIVGGSVRFICVSRYSCEPRSDVRFKVVSQTRKNSDLRQTDLYTTIIVIAAALGSSIYVELPHPSLLIQDRSTRLQQRSSGSAGQMLGR
jgi:hypothetical protein